MKIALIIAIAVSAVAVYIAWLNGLFLRCPHCRKFGAWRFDDVEPAIEQKDEDGAVSSSRQIRTCRECGKKVMDRWSDQEGHTFEKADS